MGKYSNLFKAYKEKNVEKFKELFKQLTFADLKYKKCAVTSYDLRTKKIVFFNSLQHPQVTLLDALLSTSAAPSYFPIHTFRATVPLNDTDVANDNLSMLDRKFSCVDGGVWANDPRLIALLFQRMLPENVSREKGEQKMYFILSFGTGIPKNHSIEYSNRMGLYPSAWLPSLGKAPLDLTEIFFGATGSFTDLAIQRFSDGRLIRSTRLNWPMDEPIRLDDVTKMDELEKMVEDEVKNKNYFFLQQQVGQFLAVPVRNCIDPQVKQFSA